MLIYCFTVPPIVCGDFLLVFVLVCIILCPFWFCNHHLDKEERTGCFAFFVFRMSCYCIVLWLFLTVPWICLQCLIVVFPDHTHFLQQSCYGIESWLVCIDLVHTFISMFCLYSNVSYSWCTGSVCAQ